MYVCYMNAGSYVLDFDEMMKTDDFGSLRFGHKLEYLSRARDIKRSMAL